MNILPFLQLIKALYEMGLAALKQMFESINLSDLGQRSNNGLDLMYSCTDLVNLAFSHTKALGSKVDLDVK